MPPQLFSVDAEGTGAGRIVSETGDVYEGSFLRWQRHGWGLQRWASGESFRGTWLADAQERGVFTDAQGRRWKGDFRTGNVQQVVTTTEQSAGAGAGADAEQQQGGGQASAEEDEDIAAALREEEQDAAYRQQHHRQQRDDPEHKENVTHFPASAAYAYQSQHVPLGEEDLAQTQRAHSLPAWSQTQILVSPRPPQSARSHRSNASSNGSGVLRRAGNQTARLSSTSRRRRAPPLRRESAEERLAREQREKEEEKLVLNELKQATYLLAGRYGSNRVPFETSLFPTPGPASYDPSLSQVKRTPIAHSMAPKLPYTSEVALLVKSTPSQGPWSTAGSLGDLCGVKQPLPLGRGDPTRPAAPQLSTSRPTMLPQYVKESSFFRASVPGPGAYDTPISSRGKANTISAVVGAGVAKPGSALAAAGALPPPLGGSTVKGKFIPVFTSYAHVARSQLGQGPCPAAYSPRIEQVSTHEKSPAFSMGARYKTGVRPGAGQGAGGVVPMAEYDALRAARLPGPGAHTPSLSAVRADPAAAAPAWGRSRAGQRVHPTESVRAIGVPFPGGERFLRGQLGLASPGPAAYDPRPDALSTRPAPARTTAPSFVPHLVQPQSVRIARQFVQHEQDHPFVAKFRENRAKEMAAATVENDGGEDGDEGLDEEQDVDES